MPQEAPVPPEAPGPGPVRFVLASASPARLRTLRSAGIDPEVLVSGVDESTVESSNPVVLCATLARLKAEAVAVRLRRHSTTPPRPALVLGCDSVLAFGGEVFGKPASEEEAVARWRQMRGGAGTLHTGHCLIDVATDTLAEAVASTTVRFADLTDAEITSYVSTGEPLHVAGGFTIDGLGGWFVEAIEGDAGTVIGLSLPVLRRLLAEVGHSVQRMWHPAVASSA
jgi:septum formation protein